MYMFKKQANNMIVQLMRLFFEQNYMQLLFPVLSNFCTRAFTGGRWGSYMGTNLKCLISWRVLCGKEPVYEQKKKRHPGWVPL